MQWANSSSTKIGDCKVLYKPSVKKYVLVEATKDDIGFIELNVGTYEQMKGELEYYDERTKRIISKTETVDKVLRDSEIGQNNYNGNNVNVGYGGKGIPNAQFFEDESNSNRTGNSSKTEKNSNSKSKVSYLLKKNVGDVDNDSQSYSEKDYNNFGWARANNVLNTGQNADYRSKFADAKAGRVKFNRSKNGEYIIPVSDIYDTTFEGIDNVLVFAKGTISNPIITSVIEIYEYDETSLDKVRRRIYELERRGIQQKTTELFRRYDASDFRMQHERDIFQIGGDSDGNGHGRRSGTETEAVKDQSKISYSLKKPFRPKEDWHTGLTKAQIKIVNESIRRAGSPEANRITDTACWYKGRLNGDDLFAIYSTEDAEPTVLYLVKGKNANLEQNILLNLLEEYENGKGSEIRSFGESKTVDTILGRDWVQEKYDSKNNIDRFGETRGNIGYASILQGESSEFIGRSAFRNVLENIFDIQESATVSIEEGLNGQESFSLKDKATFSTDGMTESDIENARSVIKNLKTRAISSKYVDGFASYTEERMEREIANSSSREVVDYAKSYITWVDPIDFIYATTTSEQYRNVLKEEAGSLDIEKLQNETQPIHLTVNFETGEIVGHEGRHRMLALQEKGIDKVAVIIDALNDNRRHTKPIDFMPLTGQSFAEHRKGTNMYLHDMLPLSQRYADTARELFTNKPKSRIQFSLKDSAGKTLTKEQAEFFKDSNKKTTKATCSKHIIQQMQSFTLSRIQKSVTKHFSFSIGVIFTIPEQIYRKIVKH